MPVEQNSFSPLGLSSKQVKGDGNCFYYAVAVGEGVEGEEQLKKRASELRHNLVEHFEYGLTDEEKADLSGFIPQRFEDSNGNVILSMHRRHGNRVLS